MFYNAKVIPVTSKIQKYQGELKMNENNVPAARTHNLVIQEADTELMVFDLDSNRVSILNETSRQIWNLCDGKSSVEEITAKMKQELKVEVPTDLVELAIMELGKFNLLEAKLNIKSKLNRRDVIKKIGFDISIALPVVMSAVAPKATAAASLDCSGGTNRPAGCDCGSGNQCQSNSCVNMFCT